VRFHTEHRFHGSPGAVAALLADPGFYVGLALPDLSQPEVLEQHADSDDAALVLRYEYVGSLDPMARRLLGPKRLAWIQEMHVNSSSGSGSGSGTLRFRAEADPKRLHGSADFILAGDEAGTVRQLDGELVVAVPVIGHQAERRIVPGILRRMDIEAQALDEKLRGG
jgi:hypothetical protein